MPTAPTHAYVHVVAGSHCPFVPHVACWVSLVHSVVPGTQTPPQLPGTVFSVPTHAYAHVVGVVPHCPVVSHVTCWVSLVHSIVLGLHLPEHAPATHAWLTHGNGVPHIPATQDCTAEVPEHCLAPAEQEPEHTPIEHVVLEQSTATPHVPSDPHVCTALPVLEHWVVPGVHVPVQAPFTQPWPMHVVTGESDTRSGPHWTTVVVSLHTLPPGVALVHKGSIAAHVP